MSRDLAAISAETRRRTRAIAKERVGTHETIDFLRDDPHIQDDVRQRAIAVQESKLEMLDQGIEPIPHAPPDPQEQARCQAMVDEIARLRAMPPASVPSVHISQGGVTSVNPILYEIALDDGPGGAAAAEMPGVDPMLFSSTTGGTGDELPDRVSEVIERDGCDRQQAMRRVLRDSPELREEMIRRAESLAAADPPWGSLGRGMIPEPPYPLNLRPARKRDEAKPTKDKDKPKGAAREEWDQRVGSLVESGMSRSHAARKVACEDPELHRLYLSEANQ